MDLRKWFNALLQAVRTDLISLDHHGTDRLFGSGVDLGIECSAARVMKLVNSEMSFSSVSERASLDVSAVC